MGHSPARGKGTQVVSDDYPNKSYFNQLDIKKDKFGKKEDWKDKDFGKEDWKDEEFGKKSKEVSEEEKLEIDKLLKELPMQKLDGRSKRGSTKTMLIQTH